VGVRLGGLPGGDRDVAMLSVLTRWGPAVVGLVATAGLVVGAAGMVHRGADVKLLGAALALGAILFAVLAVTLLLFVRVAVARWQPAPGARRPSSPAAPAGPAGG
jgi:hypothetical protein